MKQSQLELIEEAIESKQGSLRALVRTEDESQKLKSSMEDMSIAPVKPTPSVHSSIPDDDSNIDTKSIEDGFSAIIKSNVGDDMEESQKETIVDQVYPTSASASVLRASKNQTKKWSSPRKLFSAVSFTIQGMIDTDPEQTRRKSNSQTKRHY